MLPLFVDLPNLLLPLLRTEGRIGADGFDSRACPLLDGVALLHGRPGDARHFPARWLMHLRHSSYSTRMPWQWLNTNWRVLCGCTLAYRSENDNHEQANAQGE